MAGVVLGAVQINVPAKTHSGFLAGLNTTLMIFSDSEPRPPQRLVGLLADLAAIARYSARQGGRARQPEGLAAPAFADKSPSQ